MGKKLTLQAKLRKTENYFLVKRIKKEKELIAKFKKKYDWKVEKELLKWDKKIQKAKDTKLRKIEREHLWKKQLKKDTTKKRDKVTANKHMAFTLFQLWCRVKDSDEYGQVRPIDKPNELMHYRDVDWWHYYPKSLYPHLAFNTDNCFPQTKYSNKKLWQNIMYEFKDEVIKRIWENY